VPVVRGREVVGIVSRANLLHALASVARETRPAEQSDEAIRAQLLGELGKQAWAPLAMIDPIVNNGVVELWGTITDERERRALIVAAENLPGVKAVRDHLAWLDATSGMVVHQPDEPPIEAKAS
jgi:osmotically-inducible protein OsmY